MMMVVMKVYCYTSCLLDHDGVFVVFKTAVDFWAWMGTMAWELHWVHLMIDAF